MIEIFVICGPPLSAPPLSGWRKSVNQRGTPWPAPLLLAVCKFDTKACTPNPPALWR